MSEFSLIERYFSHIGESGSDLVLGVGDDAAVINVNGQLQCIAVDTLISGIHFPVQTSPADIAYKSLAVNLSDMAAMGASPKWATLAITLTSEQNEAWLGDFARGMHEIATRFGVQLIGGDTTRGDCLTISVQIQGVVADGKVLRRDQACEGDAIFVTGTIGDAAIGLQQLGQGNTTDYFLARLNRPTPRVSEALSLKPFINAAIDVSDGLLADLGHIMERSGLGAELLIEQVPFGPGISNLELADDDYRMLLSGGDDYELCFTVAQENIEALQRLAQREDIAIRKIGTMRAQQGLRCVFDDGRELVVSKKGYDHFAGVGA